MKCFIKKIFVINILLIYVISGIITLNIFHNTNDRTIEKENKFNHKKRTSGPWILTGSPIYIDNNDPSKNWAITEATYDWCRGSGTLKDPYIIENVTVDGQYSISNCIEIRNSEVNFVIRNCTIYNSGPSSNGKDGGIKLYRVLNATLTNNFCNSSNRNGISLIQTNRSFIIGNRITNALSDGILLLHCKYNDISKNNVSFNTYSGIDVIHCNYNLIFENRVYNNTNKFNYGGLGITLYNCHQNNLSNNVIYNNLEDGIGMDSVSHNIFSGNRIYKNRGHGIYLWYDCYQNEIIQNNISFNKWSGITLSGELNTISDNIISYNEGDGICISSGLNNILSGNQMIECGVFIQGSSSDLLSYYIDKTNLVNGKPLYYYKSRSSLDTYDFLNAGQVILFNCYYSQISNLNMSHGSCGILIITCMNITVSNNDVSYCNAYGVMVRNCENIIISQNTANNNKKYGLYLDSSNNIRVSENFVNYNNNHGISMHNSDGNTIIGNIINYNFIGIYLYYCDDNLVKGNTVVNNDQCILDLGGSGNIFEDNGSCQLDNNGEEKPSIPKFVVLFYWILAIGLVLNGVALLLLLLRRSRKLDSPPSLSF